MASPLVALLYTLLVYCILKVLRYGRREPGLPPGPPTTPVLGNLLQMPRSSVHVGFSEMAQKWGDIMSLKLAAGNMIILSSATAVKEVLDNTGWTSSSRPHMYLATLATNDCHSSLAPDSPRIREIRHLMKKFLNKSAALQQLPVQDAEISQLVYEMMTDPKNFYASSRRFSHSIAKTTLFGKRAPFFDSEDVTEFYAGFDAIARNMSPGVHPPIDLVPILKYLPDSLAPWNEIMRSIRRRRDAMHSQLYDETVARAKRGHKGLESFLETVVNLPASDKTRELTKEFVGHSTLALVDGGSDTTGTYVISLILALASYPEFQKRAQEEIDSIIGDRTPKLEDFEHLPFVDALVKEILRFRPILPLALPHNIKEDIVYKGYVIPKDSMVMMNLWAIYHDPKVFEDPEEFKPDRYLKSTYGTLPGMDTDFRDTLIFGAGRRRCPGIYVAKLTLALATMRIIWAFNISEAIDPETKQPIPLSLDLSYFHDEQVVMPLPFQCSIEPRNAQRSTQIKKAFVDATDLFTLYEGDLTEAEQQRLKEQRSNL